MLQGAMGVAVHRFLISPDEVAKIAAASAQFEDVVLDSRVPQKPDLRDQFSLFDLRKLRIFRIEPLQCTAQIDVVGLALTDDQRLIERYEMLVVEKFFIELAVSWILGLLYVFSLFLRVKASGAEIRAVLHIVDVRHYAFEVGDAVLTRRR